MTTQIPTVTYNQQRSTKLTQVYDAESRSEPGRKWRVNHDLRDDKWFCPCTAGKYGKWCGHKQAALTLERRRAWVATFAALSLDDLEAYVAHYERLQAETGLSDDERDAQHVCGEMLRAALGEAVA